MAKRDEQGYSIGWERNYQGLQEINDTDNPMIATIDMVLTKKGRPANYPQTPQGFEEFARESLGYLEFVRNKNESLEKRLVLDVESWAVYLGTTRMTINTYQKRGGQWTEFINWFKELITSVKKQGMFSYQIPPVVGIFDLKNNSGYTDKSELEVLTAQEQQRTSLERELQENGLVWNEETQSFEMEV